MGFGKEFKEFATRGNVIDLAVGMVIGAAFTKIVGSFVADIMMPLINPLIPAGDWRALKIGDTVMIGNFLGALVDFIIVAFAIFLAVKTINRFKKKEAAAPPPPAEPTKEEVLLTEIRDLLRNK